MQPKKHSFRLTQPTPAHTEPLKSKKDVKKAAAKTGVVKFFSDLFSALTFRNGL